MTTFDNVLQKYWFEFYALSDYHWKMERAIGQFYQDEVVIWSQLVDPKARFLRKREETPKLLDIFPMTLRYSYVTILYMHVESMLSELCDALCDQRSLSLRVSHLNGSLLERSKRYVFKFAGFVQSTSDWNTIDELSKIRDCIVHAGGEVARSRDEKYLVALAKHLGPDNIQIGLRMNRASEWLVIREGYLISLTKRLRDFTEALSQDLTTAV